jgi:tetraacyldisaccharide 4'-kinase
VIVAHPSVFARLWRGRVERNLSPPCPVVAVGGATLGGSGKTPLAIACTRELALAGIRTTLVGHAYRAAAEVPRFVLSGDRVEEVGDEALVAARALEGLTRAQVAVAPRRSDAITLAARSAQVVVLDGVAQTRPVRAALALLAVDAEDPWGRAEPRRALGALGGLRDGSMPQAPTAILLSACDAIVPILDVDGEVSVEALEVRDRTLASLAELGRPVWPAFFCSRGAWVGQSLLTWEALRVLRVGLITALARPARVLRSLERRGVAPVSVVSARDHGPLGRSARLRANAVTRAGAVDLWVATGKCALHAAGVLPPGARLAVLDHHVTLAPELGVSLRGLFGSPLASHAP